MPRGSSPGERRGGRKPGSRNKATAEIKELAMAFAPAAIAEAGRLSKSAESETARLAAINIILDRAYGKPKQAMEHSGPDGGPIQTADVTDDMRAKALAAFIARTKGK